MSQPAFTTCAVRAGIETDTQHGAIVPRITQERGESLVLFEEGIVEQVRWHSASRARPNRLMVVGDDR